MTSIAIDEMSIMLGGLAVVVYLYYQWNVYQPDIHGSFVNCQANTSATRLRGETCQYRHRSIPFSSDLSYRLHREFAQIHQLLSKVLEREGRVLGYQEKSTKQVVWWKGTEVKNKVLRFGNGLSSIFSEGTSQRPKVAVVAEKTYIELVLTMLAGVLFNFTLELFSPVITETSESLSQAFSKLFSEGTRPVVLCSSQRLPLVVEALKATGYTSTALVVVFESPEDKLGSFESDKIEVKLFKDIGSGTGGQLTPPSQPAGSEDVLYRVWNKNQDKEFSLASFQDKHVMASVAAISNTFPVQHRLGKDDVYASPRSILATSEWATVLYMFHNEIPVGLGDSLVPFRPTVVFLPSKDLLELAHRWGLTNNSVKKLGTIEHWVLQTELGIINRHRCLQNGRIVSTCFKKERLELGPQLRLIYTANPYIPRDILNGLRVALGAQIVATLPLSPYRPTASCASFGWTFVGTFFDYASDPKLPLVGGPAPCVESKIIDVPEENFEEPQKDPIGPVLLRGTNTVGLSQYQKDGTNLTADNSVDTWHNSGWLGRIDPTCSIAFVGSAPEPIFLNFLQTWLSAYCAPVHIIHLKVSSEADYSQMGGKIFLRSEPLLKFAQEHRLPLDPDQLLNSKDVHQYVLKGLRSELTKAIAYFAAAQRSSALEFPPLDLHPDRLSFHLAPPLFQFHEEVVKDPEFWE